MPEYPNFVTDISMDKNKRSIPVKVFDNLDGEQDYDILDGLAEEKGYFPVESQDEKFYSEKGNGLVGMQNSSLHSGWIATWGDSKVNSIHQRSLLKEKIDRCKAKGEDIIIGFCKTGHFSIGYTIYVKNDEGTSQLRDYIDQNKEQGLR